MSATAYKPYDPLNTLKPVAEDVWIVDGPEISFDYLGFQLPFATRMTVVRLPGGGLWVHSPTAATDELIGEVKRLGPVRHLVAPSTLHYWWIPEWSRLFGDAAVYAAPGLERSAKRQLPPLETLGAVPPQAWEGAIDQTVVPGDLLTEADFFHRPSRTLILTDLIENFETWRVSHRWLRWILSWSGAADPDGKAPIDMQLSFIRHRRRVRAAVETMIAWAPERIILAHGRSYETGAVHELRRAFRWVL